MKRAFWLQLFALIIALLLWMQHMLLRQQTAEFDLPFDVTGVPDSLTLAAPVPARIPVTLNARGVEIVLLSLGNGRLVVSGENLQVGENELDLSAQDLSAADFVPVGSIGLHPRHPVTLSIDRLASARFPITLRYADEEDRAWYARQSVVLEPDSVTVRGPAGHMYTLATVFSEPLHREATTGRNVNVRLASPGDLFQLEREQAILRIDKAEYVRKDFNQITIRNPYESRFAIFPGKVNLLLEGTQEAISGLKRADISVTLVSGRPQNGNEIGLDIRVPNGVRLIEYTPQTVQVIYHESSADTGH